MLPHDRNDHNILRAFIQQLSVPFQRLAPFVVRREEEHDPFHPDRGYWIFLAVERDWQSEISVLKHRHDLLSLSYASSGSRLLGHPNATPSAKADSSPPSTGLCMPASASTGSPGSSLIGDAGSSSGNLGLGGSSGTLGATLRLSGFGRITNSPLLNVAFKVFCAHSTTTTAKRRYILAILVASKVGTEPVSILT